MGFVFWEVSSIFSFDCLCVYLVSCSRSTFFLKSYIPCPGKLGANLLASCQTIARLWDKRARSRLRKDGKHSSFPYMFPDLDLDPARAWDTPPL